ncbi:hypothetical protein TVAG_133070 [Trichomonas vaginalis G3]|uniref:DUF3447 domain-containing protein n=1 Tax=Trichomonas vaginalis (strain ATCC PRA-98 / G3) TaxID=412133 RepID=A2EDI5_TRIV3|nr:protein ubiquitination [Trichomonas vaginalis G3]EAY09250.1 hypothetical protein TVAG_133070 [Trichomonas vaginalis G3]KAI5484032.1 protein ubiquitination [Trichomonas vaginalis G3]|eukprot:XP_001321473.1 hypothetical protein [Trichomonas vaginalis G3]
MEDDIKSFIGFTERSGFDEKQVIQNDFFPSEFQKNSLIKLCCYYGSVNCFKFLITKFKPKITTTCLRYSFLGGNQEIVMECLKYKTPDKFSMNYAIVSHNNDFVSFLLTQYDIPCYTYLCHLYNNIDAALIYYDIKRIFKENLTWICKFKIPSLCKYFILHGADIYLEDYKDNPATYYIVEYGWKEILELLISRGLDINKAKSLFVAAEFNWKEIVEILLANGADVNSNDYYYNKTPLLIAVQYNSKKVIDILYSHGADINVYDSQGRGVLYYVARTNNVEKAEFFMSHGLDLNKDTSNLTEHLNGAVKYNNREMVEFLISRGANVNPADRENEGPLHYAIEDDNASIAELLISHGTDLNANFCCSRTYHKNQFKSACKKAYEVTKLLISHGSDIHKINYYSGTLLHTAARNGDEKLLNILFLLD